MPWAVATTSWAVAHSGACLGGCRGTGECTTCRPAGAARSTPLWLPLSAHPVIQGRLAQLRACGQLLPAEQEQGQEPDGAGDPLNRLALAMRGSGLAAALGLEEVGCLACRLACAMPAVPHCMRSTGVPFASGHPSSRLRATTWLHRFRLHTLRVWLAPWCCNPELTLCRACSWSRQCARWPTLPQVCAQQRMGQQPAALPQHSGRHSRQVRRAASQAARRPSAEALPAALLCLGPQQRRRALARLAQRTLAARQPTSSG